MRAIDDLIRQRDALSAAIAAEQARVQGMTKEQQFAEMLHTRLCHSNHTDGCGWGYETDWKHGVHLDYLERAKSILYGWTKLDPSRDDFMKVFDGLIDKMNGR